MNIGDKISALSFGRSDLDPLESVKSIHQFFARTSNIIERPSRHCRRNGQPRLPQRFTFGLNFFREFSRMCLFGSGFGGQQFFFLFLLKLRNLLETHQKWIVTQGFLSSGLGHLFPGNKTGLQHVSRTCGPTPFGFQDSRRKKWAKTDRQTGRHKDRLKMLQIRPRKWTP